MSGNDEKNTNQVAAINLIKQRNSAFAAVLKKAEIAAGGAAPAANPGGEKSFQWKLESDHRKFKLKKVK